MLYSPWIKKFRGALRLVIMVEPEFDPDTIWNENEVLHKKSIRKRRDGLRRNSKWDENRVLHHKIKANQKKERWAHKKSVWISWEYYYYLLKQQPKQTLSLEGKLHFDVWTFSNSWLGSSKAELCGTTRFTLFAQHGKTAIWAVKWSWIQAGGRPATDRHACETKLKLITLPNSVVNLFFVETETKKTNWHVPNFRRARLENTRKTCVETPARGATEEIFLHGSTPRGVKKLAHIMCRPTRLHSHELMNSFNCTGTVVHPSIYLSSQTPDPQPSQLLRIARLVWSGLVRRRERDSPPHPICGGRRNERSAHSSTILRDLFGAFSESDGPGRPWQCDTQEPGGEAKALFSSEKLVKNGTVVLSFLFDKHCPIIE